MKKVTALPSLCLALALLLALAGCTSGAGGFLGRIFGRKAAATAAAQSKVAQLEDDSVQAAQLEVAKTGEALAAAEAENPGSLPVAIARRTNANAFNILNLRQPLTPTQMSEAKEIVAGLLQRTEAAEARQAAAERSILGMTEELATQRQKVVQLQKEAAEEAAANLALANELRVQSIMKWGGFALSTALGLLAIAYKLNIGRLQTGLGETLAHINEKHGSEASDAARKVAGVVLHSGEQKGVFKVYSALTK